MDLSQPPRLYRKLDWVHQHPGIFHAFGAFFFVLSGVFGIVWLCGKDVEAFTFLFGLIANVFFAAPAIADRLVDRKPVSELCYEEILDLVANSNPQVDWRAISNEKSDEFFYIYDSRLRILHPTGEEGIQNEDFKEKWANGFPDPKACGLWYYIRIDQGNIRRFLLVAVDGLKVCIPCPKPDKKTIGRLEDKIGQIVAFRIEDYEEYKRRIGIEVEES